MTATLPTGWKTGAVDALELGCHISLAGQDGSSANLYAQQLSSPLSVADISGGASSAQPTTDAAGNRSWESTQDGVRQIVVVSPNGFMVNLVVSSNGLDGTPPMTQSDQDRIVLAVGVAAG